MDVPSPAVPLPGETATTRIDRSELPDGVIFTYWTQARFGTDIGVPSLLEKVTAQNDPPVANADLFTRTPLPGAVVVTGNVLSNDTDVDSEAPNSQRPKSAWRAVQTSALTPNVGTLTLPSGTDGLWDGSFTFTAPAGWSGTVSFRYKANNGTFAYDTKEGGVRVPHAVSMSQDSNEATATITVTNTATKKLTVAGPADIWLGLKNSADVGTKFDVLAEVMKNGAVVAKGQVTAVTLGGNSLTYSANKAVLKEISLAALALPADLVSGDTLSLRMSVKVNSASTRGSAQATLWFNLPGTSGDDSSHLHATIGGSADKYFLVSGFALKKNIAGSGAIASADVTVDKNLFKSFGTWTIVMP